MASTRMRIAKWNPEGFMRAIDGSLAVRMEQAAGYVEREVKRSMKGGGDPHVPSRPGEPPRVDTGELRRSIHHKVEVKRSSIRGYVIAGAPYARALELGYAPGNLLPRPYLRPALRRSQPGLVRILLGKGPSGYTSLADIKAATARGFVSRASFGGGA